MSLSLGLFMPNCSNMPSISTRNIAPNQWYYEANERIALYAETLGFRYLFPVSRWRGFGGDTNFLGESLETMTWAASLLKATSKINVFSTVHVPLFHPFVVAKMGATLAHVSQDRWGLNVVSGWSQREFGMMGIQLEPHNERYQKTAAFVEILRELWSGNFPVNHSSEWYQILDGESRPVPSVQPAIANAGTSEDAQSMTARLCDWAFISLNSVDQASEVVSKIRKRVRMEGRTVKVAVFPFLLWRDSKKAAQEELDQILAETDRVAANNWMNDLTAGSGSFDDFTLDMLASSGGAIHVMGTSEDVAEQLARLDQAGVDAVMLTFQDYEKDLRRFAEEVMPLLSAQGVI